MASESVETQKIIKTNLEHEKEEKITVAIEGDLLCLMEGEHECFLINISSMLPVFPDND